MIGCIIQARLGSTRLPSKVLRNLAGKPMVQHVIERAHKISGLDQIVCAVPVNDMVDIQTQVRSDVFWFGGDPDDVLDRYFHAALSYGFDVIMRLTGDCPLIDPVACSRVLDEFMLSGAMPEYASNIDPATDGLDCEVFTWNALAKAYTQAKDPYDREHVTPWMRRNLRCIHIAEPALPAKWSVDTEEDFRRVEEALR